MDDQRPAAAKAMSSQVAVGSLMDTCDWSTSPLGSPEIWSRSLRSVTDLMLGSRFPMFVAWGANLGFLYNDAYAEILGAKHPEALGRPMEEVWREIWPDVGPMVDAALGGQAIFHENLPVTVNRQGFDEQAWFTFSYSPVRDDNDSIAGVFCTAVETTAQLLAERSLRASEARLRFLDDLNAATGSLSDADVVLEITTRMLGEHLGVAVCAYASMDEDQDRFTVRGDWAAPGSTSIVGHYSLADFGKLAVRNLTAGQPLVVTDTLRELGPNEAAAFQSFEIAATICMPLVKEGRLTALMAVNNREPRVWTEEELGLMHEVTERSWAHIERVSAVADLKTSEAALRKLNLDLERQVIERTLARGRTWQISPDLMGALNSEGYPASGRFYLDRGTLGRNEGDSASCAVGEPASRGRRDVANLCLDTVARTRCGTASRCRKRRYRRAQAKILAGRTAERDQLWTLSSDMLAHADYSGKLLAVSPAWPRLLGFSEAELLSRPYSDFMHVDDRQATLDAIPRLACAFCMGRLRA